MTRFGSRICVVTVVLSALLLVAVPQAKADTNCTVTFGPDPLILVSIDIFDISGFFVGTLPGSGVITAGTHFPECVQLVFGSGSLAPLAFVTAASPITFGEFWISQYLWVDDGSGRDFFFGLPFYPFVVPGFQTVVGVDFGSGDIFQGTAGVVLLVFTN